MHKFKEMVDHYKSTHRLDNETAWDIISSFDSHFQHKTQEDKDACWEIMCNIHEKIKGPHFDEVYGEWQVEEMYHIDGKGNKITSHMFTPEDAKKIYDKRVRNINSNITVWDVYVALNAQYHDNIVLYEKWFGNISEDEMKEKIIEATIVNWFEDVDADDDKVWEYFKAI
jgi:hypothetical protein|nr:MAG TPA: hypothetical protein [Crassvirales sp.]